MGPKLCAHMCGDISRNLATNSASFDRIFNEWIVRIAVNVGWGGYYISWGDDERILPFELNGELDGGRISAIECIIFGIYRAIRFNLAGKISLLLFLRSRGIMDLKIDEERVKNAYLKGKINTRVK